MVEDRSLGAPLITRKQKSFFTRIGQKYFGKTAGDIAFNIVNYLIFAILFFICLYPFLHVLFESLTVWDVSDPDNPRKAFGFDSYIYIFKDKGIFRSFLLSIGVVAVFTALSVFITVLSAYPLSKRNLAGKKIITFFVLFCMLFSGGLIPYYLLIKDLGLKNNILVYIITGLLSPYNIIIVKNFITGLPEEIFESARVDGSSEIRTLFRIVFPLSGPIVATISLWEAVGKWNNWMTGVLYVTDRSKWMIQQYLRNLLSTTINQSGVVDSDVLSMSDGIKMATIIISILPIIIVYPFIQRYFVKGTLLGSVKG